jgi:HD-like signal output (HDOD) protein
MTRAEQLVHDEPGLARIIDTIEEIGSLPTIPAAAQRAMELARSERTSMRDIAEVISQDQALAATVLKVVNSAYYGLRQSVGTLPLALTVLGVREIINLVLGVSVLSAFPTSSDSELFSREALWHASAQCAYAAKNLAHGVGLGRLASEAFLGALVHDIGLIILDQYLHDEFIETLRSAQKEGRDPIAAELDRLGTTHASIGAWLAERWSFPEPLVEAIACHHDPEKSSWESPLTALVYLAELIVTLRDQVDTIEEAAGTLDAEATWGRLTSLGPPVRRPASTVVMLDEVCAEIESAPLSLGVARRSPR